MAAVVESIAAIEYMLLAIIAIVVVPLHIRHVFRILGKFGQEQNRLGSILKAFAVFMYGLTIVLGAILRAFWFDQSRNCLSVQLMNIATWKIALTAQYLCYAAIIYQMGYSNIHTLKWLSRGIVLSYFILTILLLILVCYEGTVKFDEDNMFPYKCVYNVSLDNPKSKGMAAFIGISLLLLDGGMAVWSIMEFTRCHAEACKKAGKAKPYDSKSKILVITTRKFKTVVCLTSTLKIIWLAIAIFEDVDIASILAGIDYLITMVGLIVMTRGHQHEYWFKMFFGKCISKQEEQMAVEMQSAKTGADDVDVDAQTTNN